jgi:hypothetical protein
MMARSDRGLGSALILSAGDSESFRESRTSFSCRLPRIVSHSEESSSPQNAATNTLQARAPQNDPRINFD